MANVVEKVNTIAIASIEAINSRTDANIEALNALEESMKEINNHDINKIPLSRR